MRSETNSISNLKGNTEFDTGMDLKLLVASYRYGMLTFILVLFANCIHLYNSRPPRDTSDPYGSFVIILMLLFNHLAYMFKWPRKISIALRTLAWTWLAFGLYYVTYLGHALFPLR